MSPYPFCPTDTDFSHSVQAMTYDHGDESDNRPALGHVPMLCAALVFVFLLIGVVALVAHLVKTT